jgi:predicted RNase H-like nuclease (RuvC/YqgF family)
MTDTETTILGTLASVIGAGAVGKAIQLWIKQRGRRESREHGLAAELLKSEREATGQHVTELIESQRTIGELATQVQVLTAQLSRALERIEHLERERETDRQRIEDLERENAWMRRAVKAAFEGDAEAAAIAKVIDITGGRTAPAK